MSTFFKPRARSFRMNPNNFNADEPRTRAYASLAFDAKGRMMPIRTE